LNGASVDAFDYYGRAAFKFDGDISQVHVKYV